MTHFHAEDYALSHHYCFFILITVDHALAENQLLACFASLQCQQRQTLYPINGIITTVSMLEKASSTTYFTYQLLLQSPLTNMALHHRVRTYASLSSKAIIQQLLTQSNVLHTQLNYCALENPQHCYFYQNNQIDLDCFHALIAMQDLIYTIESFHGKSRLTLSSSLSTLNTSPSSLLQPVTTNGITEDMTTCVLLDTTISHLAKHSRLTTVLNSNVALQLGQHILLGGRGFYLIAKTLDYHSQQGPCFSQKLSLLADDVAYSLPSAYSNKSKDTFILANTPTQPILNAHGKYTLQIPADNHCRYDSVSDITFSQLQLGSNYGFHFPVGGNTNVVCCNLHNQALVMLGVFNDQASTDCILSSRTHQLRIIDKPSHQSLHLGNRAHQIALENTQTPGITLEAKQGPMSIRSSTTIDTSSQNKISTEVAQFQRSDIDDDIQFITHSGSIELHAALNLQFKSLDKLSLRTYRQQLRLSTQQLLLQSTESLQCRSTQGDIHLGANTTLAIHAPNTIDLHSDNGSISIQSGSSLIQLCQNGDIYLKAKNINVVSDSISQQSACLSINQ